MASATQVIVKVDASATQTKGDWIVKVGAGRGGKKISRHRLKSAAMKRARREGRKRKDQPGGAVLIEQHRDGALETVATYGDAEKPSKSLLSKIFKG